MDDHVTEEIDIAIVGGGICGLATALALHRKGLKSVVLERSETIRATGSGIAIQANGWRALDQLGVGSTLRQHALLLHGVRDMWLGSGKQSRTRFEEARCVKRSDLVEVLADDLPPGTIRFGCHILSVKLDSLTSLPVIYQSDGSTIRAKVLIGCDGANSAVADFLKLKPKKVFKSCAVRAFTNYPNGHGFPPELFRVNKDNILLGRVPVNDTVVFWFVIHQSYPTELTVAKDPEFVRQIILNTIKGFPTTEIEMVKNCNLTSLSQTHLRYRAPWDILLGSFRKGTVTVAGDSMHVMGPFVGQGGSAGLEDAVVLARSLARKIHEKYNDFTEGSGLRQKIETEKIGEGLDAYVKERKMRLVKLSTQTYLIGSLLDSSSMVVKFMIIALMAILFWEPFGHARFDVGRLYILYI